MDSLAPTLPQPTPALISCLLQSRHPNPNPTQAPAIAATCSRRARSPTCRRRAAPSPTRRQSGGRTRPSARRWRVTSPERSGFLVVQFHPRRSTGRDRTLRWRVTSPERCCAKVLSDSILSPTIGAPASSERDQRTTDPTTWLSFSERRGRWRGTSPERGRALPP